jgi:hypothetical protein
MDSTQYSAEVTSAPSLNVGASSPNVLIGILAEKNAEVDLRRSLHMHAVASNVFGFILQVVK